MKSGLRKSIQWMACAAVAVCGTSVFGQEHPVRVPTAAFAVPMVGGEAEAKTAQLPADGPGVTAEAFDLAPGEELLKVDPVPGLEPSALPTGAVASGGSCHHCNNGGMMGYSLCDCNAGCNQNGYGFGEVLYFKRDRDDGFTHSQNAVLDEFEHELGLRITVGEFVDCFDAIEFVYTGQLEWNNSFTLTGAPNNLAALYVPGAPLALADFDTFFNATDQQHLFEASYDSFEINQRTWGWDVISVLVGFRYIDYNERFVFNSVSAAGVGSLRQRIQNNLFGAQIGGDIYEPVSLRGSVGLRGRAGLFWLNAQGDTVLVNNGTTLVNNHPEEDSFVGLIELGVKARYQLTQNWKVSGGLEFWYMEGMATVRNEFRTTTISPLFSSNLDTDEDVSFYGATAGVEYWY